MKKVMKKTVRMLVMALLMLTQLTAAAPASAEMVYINSHDGLCVRETPGGEILSVVPFGTAVRILDSKDKKAKKGWLHIDYGDNGAYISAEFTQKTNPLAEMTHMGEWRITAYAETGFPCANGNYPEEGYTIACNSLPFGTEVYISGVGFRTVEDRGPDWMGDEWLDLYMTYEWDCIQWGNQYRDVFVVEDQGDE